MKAKFANLYWGLILIAGGGITLAQQWGHLNHIDPLIWIAVYIGISITSLVVYGVSGIQNWSLLFPAGIFAALAFLVSMAVNGVNHPAMTAPLFVSIGLPFGVAYLLNRKQNWWALIPAGIMSFLALTMLVVEDFGGEIIGSGFFFILAASFALVYRARRMAWAGLVSYILAVLGFMPLLAMGSRPEIGGLILIFALAIPFALFYLRNAEKNWWALIPAGILGTGGILATVVLLTGIYSDGYYGSIPNALMYAGTAATFAVVGLRHKKTWALFASAGALFLGLDLFFVGNLVQFWPLIIVVMGLYMVYDASRRRAIKG